MSGFYPNQRQYFGNGPIAKKPRIGPRPHMPGQGQTHAGSDGKLLSFKEFVLSASDDINEQEALARYSDYKTDYTRKQIDKFFKEHQEEEWFRNKYRPVELKKIQEATEKSKIRRKELYKELIERQSSDISVDYEHKKELEKLIRDFSLLLEGATLEELESPDEELIKYEVSSIFIPALHPAIDKSVLEEHAKKHEGFLRVAMSEAQPDKGFKRRAWITYKHMDPESIKKLCWDYNATKFSGQEVKTLVNKEMDNRIRITHFWFNHAKAAKADLKNVAKLLVHFDGEDSPLLEKIKDHLIEETNEEQQLLGVNEQNMSDFEFTQDQELLKALDQVIIYLRLVHSYDYYASTEYAGEDDMPQRVGIMFARATTPHFYGDSPNAVLKEFIAAHKARIESYLDKPTLSEKERKLLGHRNAEEEVENFIYEQTQEKRPGEKYICKLTKKKFTSPEYVRKHIIGRCGDKLDEVRVEVAFFNNYIADPRRIM